MVSINTTSNNAMNNETMDSSNNGTLLYKATARNLREYHGVPSMTADNLEKTMVLLRLRPGRLVVQGLAPEKLLKGFSAADAHADTTDSSGSSGSEVEPEQADDNQVSDDSNSNSSDSGDTEHDNIRKHNSLGFETNKRSKHPVHAALVAAGITLRPRETRPLLRALGVGPHRLVKLGLVQREELRRSRPGGRRGGPSHLRHGHPGGPGGRGHHHHRGGRGMGRPRGPPPYGPPPHRHVHGHGKRRAHGDHLHSSGPVHEPPPGPFHESGRPLHGPGHHHHHHGGGESDVEQEEMAMHTRPRGPPHGMPPPPHLRRQQGGPPPHGMPMHDREMHLHHGPGHHHHRDDVESSGSEEEDGTEMCVDPRAHPPPHGHPRDGGGRDGRSGHHGKSHLDSEGDDFMATHGPAGPPPGSPPRGRFHEDSPDGNNNAQEHHQPPPMMPMQPC
ncbi:unnamed protein product [Ectocarpus sp. CCAP 1310/34]|nr:unnamed protein product [Ectocarpus sp. CCAP 1310/34]